jgi:hypothetical protein
MAESGIRQFLDIGTGIPTANNTHPARDQVDIATKAEESLTKSMGQKVTFRTREQVSRFFSGLALADPGVVAIQDWRADSALDLNSGPHRHVGRRGPQELTRRFTGLDLGPNGLGDTHPVRRRPVTSAPPGCKADRWPGLITRWTRMRSWWARGWRD